MQSVESIVRAGILCCVTALFVAGAMPVASAQTVFSTAEAAADAFGNAIAASDREALAKVLGPDHRQMVPENGSQEDVYRFLQAWSRKHEIIPEGDGLAWIGVGDSGWVLPVPLERNGQGWRFGAVQGAAELRRRAIARNELAVIDALRELQAAQTRYWQGVGKGRYASQLVSRPGRLDGLYWPALPGSPPSVFGSDALVMTSDVPVGDSYHGYRFKVLTDKYDSNAYWILAWPAQYRRTGIASFVVGAQGGVRETDLGPSSARRAQLMLGTVVSFEAFEDVKPAATSFERL